jgi:bile acid-coenzyme A ligase
MTGLTALADVLKLYIARQTPCLVHGDFAWTWAELDDAADEWAAHFVASGVRPDDLVAFSLSNSPRFFAVAFGIYKAGATPAPLSPKLPQAELDEILEIMRPAALVRDWDALHAAPAAAAAPRPAAKSWKACTSGGSTGRPKVIVDHRPAAFDPEQTFIGLPRDSTVLVPGPLYHNAPFSAAILALARGNCVVTMDRFDADAALSLLETHAAQWTLMVPTMMHRIWRLPGERRAAADLRHLETVVHTAAPMAPWLKAAWIEWLGPERIWEVYGATEGLVRTWIGGEEWLERPGSVGRPIGGSQLAVLDPEGRRVPTGAVGEVFAMPPGGPSSTYHYLGAERRATQDGWESVGDIGWVDEEGYLFLADRRTDLIITGGVNVFPAEVEAALLQHPQIASCAVVGLPDDDLGQSVHAVVETRVALSLDELRLFLRPRLSPTKIPRSLETQAEPVRDDAGKVRRSELAAAARNEVQA